MVDGDRNVGFGEIFRALSITSSCAAQSEKFLSIEKSQHLLAFHHLVCFRSVEALAQTCQTLGEFYVGAGRVRHKGYA
jgi:hypothetical protein